MLKDKIAGCLAGMVYGDAYGVPGELWPRQKLRERFGIIKDFLDGPEDNIVACYFKAGHYTDDSAQAFVLLNNLLKFKKAPPHKDLVADLIAWVKSMNGFEINLLGPSSKAALMAINQGEDPSCFTKIALTNGAAMRIAPVGCFYSSANSTQLARMVAHLSKVTHNTDVTIAGATMIATAVACGLDDLSWEQKAQQVLRIYDYAMTLGEPTWAASIKSRFELSLDTMGKFSDDDEFSLWVYNTIGTGTMTSESVTAALAIAFFTQDTQRCAQLCANLGGDTDTIGAMACAICGAHQGMSKIDPKIISYLETTNNLNFKSMATQIVPLRDQLECIDA